MSIERCRRGAGKEHHDKSLVRRQRSRPLRPMKLVIPFRRVLCRYNSKINVVAYRELCRITSMINFSRNH